VNDGSPDDVLQHALAIQRGDEHVRIVDLSRNFGHHHAAVAGLTEARGERVFLIDVDLEEQPEWLPEFWERLEATGRRRRVWSTGRSAAAASSSGIWPVRSIPFSMHCRKPRFRRTSAPSA
jgi:putative glycosyltransferase